MINRVFCYSEKVANQHNCFVNQRKLKLRRTILVILLCVSLIIPLARVLIGQPPSLYLLPFIILFILLLLNYMNPRQQRAQVKAFSSDDTGRIFLATFIADETAVSNSTFLKIIKTLPPLISEKGISGSNVIVDFTINNTTKLMSQPEFIAGMIEHATEISTLDATLLEILNVYQHTETEKFVTIVCDYKCIQTGKIYYQKKIKIYKAYNCFDELFSLILKHKVC